MGQDQVVLRIRSNRVISDDHDYLPLKAVPSTSTRDFVCAADVVTSHDRFMLRMIALRWKKISGVNFFNCD